ncbi:uncharacterized protein LOC119767665 [Culex quinquefasciatus]|uniref:uncharacterized protein LOC119767665 n=1 Tax=Culex quinquefasciatus TaxID=7176 RepID=UPI0018E2C29D|nr:uncharacterized protein LOC119767665 [Culex quinquefasciatus]
MVYFTYRAVSEYITARNNGTTINGKLTLDQIVDSFGSWETMCWVGVCILVILVFSILLAYSVVATVYIFFIIALVSLALALCYTAIQAYTTWSEGNVTSAKTWIGTSLMWILVLLLILLFAARFAMALFRRNSKEAIGSIKAACKSIRLSAVFFSSGVDCLLFMAIVLSGMVALKMASVGNTYSSALPVIVMLLFTFILSTFRSMVLAYIAISKKAALTLGAAIRFVESNDFITIGLWELAATIIFSVKILWQIYDWMNLGAIGFIILFVIKIVWMAMQLCLGKRIRKIDAYVQLSNFENAYIVRAISGKSFIASAKLAGKMLREDSLQDTDSIFQLLHLAPMCVLAPLGYALFSWQQIVPTIVAAVGTYFTTATFLHPFKVVVKTAEFSKLIVREDNAGPSRDHP